MSEVKTLPVKGKLVADIDQDDAQPGDFELSGEPPRGLWYRCPCGCRSQGFLAIRPAEPAHPSWAWDGNREAPTLEPSIHHVGHWHGYLRAGVWESC
jgi:hypothetical protein